MGLGSADLGGADLGGADLGGADLGGAGASGAAEAWAGRGGVSLPRPEFRSGPWPGGRIGAEGWPGAGTDGTCIESSRRSQTPRAGSSRRGVNAAGACGASAGREADVGADAWPAADAGLAHGGSLTGRWPIRDGPDRAEGTVAGQPDPVAAGAPAAAAAGEATGSGTAACGTGPCALGSGVLGSAVSGSAVSGRAVSGWAVPDFPDSSRQLTAAPTPSASRATPLTPIAM